MMSRMEDMQKELKEAQSQEANLFIGFKDSEDILHVRRKELEQLNTQVIIKVPFVMNKNFNLTELEHFINTFVQPGGLCPQQKIMNVKLTKRHILYKLFTL